MTGERAVQESDLERQIALVLAHPGISAWLKAALHGAMQGDPLVALNDLEILGALLRQRAGIHLSRSLCPCLDLQRDSEWLS